MGTGWTDEHPSLLVAQAIFGDRILITVKPSDWVKKASASS